MAQLLISAAHKSSGKTTISLGLCAALSHSGLRVSPFKKGPDYIDPMWLTRAAARPCYNLDFNTLTHDEILSLFSKHQVDSDLSLIEGNKGLYDGLDLDGSNSNAALAKLLKAPVVLVIDAQGMTRGIAPLILGYQAFDPEIQIAGVILNKLGGSRHEAKLRAVIEHYTNVPVIGAVHKDPRLHLLERHLGLMPSNEDSEAQMHIDNIAAAIREQVDLHRIRDIAKQAPQIAAPISSRPVSQHSSTDLRIAIARDPAFGFYYPDDLEAFARAGVTLVPFNSLTDITLPKVDALIIGGGFPETHMAALEANHRLRTDIRQQLQQGLPCYAECGGLMYLTRQITWQGKTHQMVGALPADTRMHDKPKGRGLVKLSPTVMHPWLQNNEREQPYAFNAHEFHYSSLENLGGDLQFAYAVKRGAGITGKLDGLVHGNILACYAHLRNVSAMPWVDHFVDFVRQQKQQVTQNANAV